MTDVYNHGLKAKMEVSRSYNNGENLIYKNLVKHFARRLRANIRAKHQNVVVVIGSTGSGKSTIAIHICLAIDPKWDLESNYIYDVDDLKRKLKKPQSKVSLFDEGSVILNSKNTMKSEDKEIMTLFDTMRSLGWTTVICVPKLASLNKGIRESHLNYVVVCPEKAPLRGYDARGFFHIHTAEHYTWGGDWYPMIATGTYPKLPKKLQLEYDRIKLEHQMRQINKFIGD